MQVAILAGGLATRLGYLTRGQPKSMVRIEERPFLEYQLEFLRKAGVRDVVLCTGHLGEQIENYFGNGALFGMSIKYSREPSPLGTAGALKNAEPLLEDIFFTLYGDSYLFLNFGQALSHFRECNKLALMTVYRNDDRYDKSNTVVEGELVKRYSKQERTEDMIHIEYGANIFSKRVLELIPKGEPCSLEALFPSLIERGELAALEVRERFYEIGSPRGLEEFTTFVRGAA